MTEEESAQKTERIILDLNKNGLSYLTNSNDNIIKICTMTHINILRRHKKQLLNN